MKIKKIFKNWRVIILILFLLFAYITINPQFGVEGVAIKHIDKNSSSSMSGLISPASNIPDTKLELIQSINGKKVSNIDDYSNLISSIEEGEKVKITTNKGTYNFLKTNNIGIAVKEASKSNIKKGLELAGGTRVLLKPEEKIDDNEINDLISSMENRLNVYGLSDVKIKSANDLLGNKYIVVEIAGASQEEVRDLIEKQGVFEAKIRNETVFKGGEEDVTFVCRNDGACSGIRNCDENQDGSHYCKFEFAIKLSEKAANKQAEVTQNIAVEMTDGGKYLKEPLDLYLDGVLVDSLNIGEDLKGKAIKDISISGPGLGATREEAVNNALKQMNHLQTVLITGSLKTKLEVIKLDSISPILGEEFVKNAFLIGFLAILAVAVVVFIRYRNLKISIPIIITTISEVIILLGVASFIKWNLDMAAIAGIIAAVGTGVDDLIIITDEVSRKEGYFNWKDRIKKAFFIIFAAYATTVVAMLPLLKAGAGLLTGFALMTIAGVSIGVFITRPAFAAIIENLLEE